MPPSALCCVLGAERAGYKLAMTLVSTLVSYLVGTVELNDVSELDLTELLTTAEEAWASTHEGEELPNVHRVQVGWTCVLVAFRLYTQSSASYSCIHTVQFALENYLSAAFHNSTCSTL